MFSCIFEKFWYLSLNHLLAVLDGDLWICLNQKGNESSTEKTWKTSYNNSYLKHSNYILLSIVNMTCCNRKKSYLHIQIWNVQRWRSLRFINDKSLKKKCQPRFNTKKHHRKAPGRKAFAEESKGIISLAWRPASNSQRWWLKWCYFGVWTLQNKAQFNQNKGHWGSMNKNIYIYIAWLFQNRRLSAAKPKWNILIGALHPPCWTHLLASGYLVGNMINNCSSLSR